MVVFTLKNYLKHHITQKLLIMSNVSYYTPEGLKKLKDELLQLEQIERPRVTQEIEDARDKGD